MRRYFFDIFGSETVRDADGSELDGDDAARSAAVALAGSYLSDFPELLLKDKPFRLELRDDAGRCLLKLTFQAEQ